MAATKTDIWVYAHWKGMGAPKCIGVISAQQSKGSRIFGFEYDKDWLKSDQVFLLDPEIGLYPGTQYPDKKDNFGVFMDSMPDTWGRKLMLRRAAQRVLVKGESTPKLYEIDFLLGVHDVSRMGALRFKLDPNGSFLDDNKDNPTPPITNLRELQASVKAYEEDEDGKNGDEWIPILFAPGSSLGGARPKANVIDLDGHLCIAKFPSKADTTDKAAWEYLAYELACRAGINMAICTLEKVRGPYHTFLSRRFDREAEQRIHFASAMTMTRNSEDTIRDVTPSYLEIAEFIQTYGSNIEADLHQLWRRIVFHMAISNTDDHFRNHGFLLEEKGWRLSPAYDINPSIDKNGLALNVDMDNNELDFELAKSVGQFFQLNKDQMDKILDEIVRVTEDWRPLASKLGISRADQETMSPAFRLVTG
ncbi:type II toxin-antitoxin system HipA family toxin [Pedobacter psychroterrae]|uniref:Type II toxin-antitoxin system HipA family toxin n=1 Tax=Pedobacter psychroterrae TaxID=2530453 RepID=A0A4R0NUM9_9SPHI|nr:HipA domain-containing protein [Pedobacter psychroterrae]TCD03878.1 type II toxin-antitoxin system HipA family toxin [Pedobacter psychroterrae]